jgi:hypothetical protein
MTRIQPPANARRLLAAIVAVTLATGLAVVRARSEPLTTTAAATVSTAPQAPCLPGVGRLGENETLPGVAGAALTVGVPDNCLRLQGLESPEELALISHQLALRFGTSTPDALANAIAQKGRVSRAVAPVRGGANRWEPVGKTPLLTTDPSYETYAQGQPKAAGRISDFAIDERRGRILAAIASGGVYATSDFGGSWVSLGDGLPTQQVGSVAHTPAAGGRIIALTGDNAFGGYTYAGVGAYWTKNDGRTWVKSKGIPNGAMGFRLEVDPTNPSVVYAATGLGLYRSTNAGTSFTNVRLPTGPCAGKTVQRPCFLANIVTDVVVQAPDTFGNAGGAVLAVVGWRAGAFENADDSVQSPENGLYLSPNGKPGTFVNLDEDGNGFAPQANIGRVELGAATGPEQNHDYVYAIVQDAELFNEGKYEGLDQAPSADPFGLGIDPTATPTYLNGVYVSGDFGETWTLVASRHAFLNPATGSVLAQLQPLGFGPGIQSWYNAFVKPDPTRQVNGIPTRLVVGLEEVWQNRLTQVPVAGPSDFHVIGAYVPNTGGCLLVLAQPACAQQQSATPFNTTTHPDQHGAIWIPRDEGGVTLVVGNDGGAYVQTVDEFMELTQIGFGEGNQDGFHTLLPYGVDVANDGVIYAGLQDNGQIRIERDGTQNHVRGGDGIFTVVDPKNSDIVWEETPGAGIAVSTDGGHTWLSANPFVDNPSFYAPLVMDPKDSNHLISGGRQIVENVYGPEIGTASTDVFVPEHDWAEVFELGTRLHPGQAPEEDPLSGYPILEPGDSQNMLSAAQVQGDAVYGGYCGGCDPVRDHDTFASGIATNVGSGWHIAKARGLPDRLITSITIDPKNPRTIYVTLGASSYRPYAPPGALGPDGVDAGGGLVWKSTDAGNTFADVSGNLPKIGGGWSVLRGDQLLVGTTVGVFASTGSAKAARKGKPLTFAVLGKGLPHAPVFSMSLKKNDPNTLVIATLGRGVYRYRFR